MKRFKTLAVLFTLFTFLTCTFEAQAAKDPKQPKTDTDTPEKDTDTSKNPGTDTDTDEWQITKVFKNGLFKAREARCKTAICGGGTDDTWFAVEPLLDIPMGLTFALPNYKRGQWNTGPLTDYVNNHDFSISFVAGLRFWFWYDIVSFSIYFSKPVLEREKAIHIKGSDYPHSAANVRRPYPGFAIGLLGDTLWIGFDINELRNGDQTTNMDPNFRPNQVLSRVWTITIGIAPANTLRSGIGTALSRDTKDAEKEVKEAEEKAKIAREDGQKAEAPAGDAEKAAQSTRPTAAPAKSDTETATSQNKKVEEAPLAAKTTKEAANDATVEAKKEDADKPETTATEAENEAK
ncbi:MAG: hypothetical protein JXR76_22275 [Deltaproteobacteria bacterium]|nr:hypothetical protein [Deltaproteobacteria bacterium]